MTCKTKIASTILFILGMIILLFSYFILLYNQNYRGGTTLDHLFIDTMHPYIFGWGLLTLGWSGLLVERLIEALKPKE